MFVVCFLSVLLFNYFCKFFLQDLDNDNSTWENYREVYTVPYFVSVSVFSFFLSFTFLIHSCSCFISKLGSWLSKLRQWSFARWNLASHFKVIIHHTNKHNTLKTNTNNKQKRGICCYAHRRTFPKIQWTILNDHNAFFTTRWKFSNRRFFRDFGKEKE